MSFEIPNNDNYDMPADTFFKFHFLTHRCRIYTAKSNMRFGEMTVALLNTPSDTFRDLLTKTFKFADFVNSLVIKNEQSMTEFVNRIIELQEIAIKIPPYCYTNIDLEKEKQLAEEMKDSHFYGKLYDVQSYEYETFAKYRYFYSTFGTALFVFYCCVEELSDDYFSQVRKRCESDYIAAWGAFNEFSTLTSELASTVPYYDMIKVSEIMDIKLGISGMFDPDDKSKLILADTCEFTSAHSAVHYDFFKGIQHGHAPIRCQNCEQFFLASDGYKTFYCNNKAPDKSNRTCRQLGAKNKHKEKAENNPIIQVYKKARKRYYQQYLRAYITDDDYKKICRYLETMRDNAIRGKTDTEGNLIKYTTLEELFEKNTLFKTLGIGESNG